VPIDYDRLHLGLHALTLAGSSHVHVGYAQIYIRPLGWADGYQADLTPVVDRIYARHYAPELERGAWNQPSPALAADALTDAVTYFQELTNGPSPMRLAARRLHSAGLRHAEDDALLDVCIALEAAVGDTNPAEMTHKIALRAAAVLRHSGVKSDRTFKIVKQLYAWRSAIVHGGDPRRARRAFARDDALPASAFAAFVVREVLGSQLRSKTLTADVIDKAIFDALDSKSSAG
jgi:hypothetical protein